MNPRAIDTRYKGCKFRSRLEARHAVFFDHLRLKWEYEPEGFMLPGGPYLPDFHIPPQHRTAGVEFWFEIKPNIFEAEADRRIFAFEESTQPLIHDEFGSHYEQNKGVQFVMLIGQIPGSDWWSESGAGYLDSEYTGHTSFDQPYLWCVCPCGNCVGLQFDGRGARIPCECNRCSDSDKGYSQDHPDLIEAYTAARSARFEFGEQG
jgi:hypothetical protein